MSKRCPSCRKVKPNNQFPQVYTKKDRRKKPKGTCHTCRYVRRLARHDNWGYYLKQLCQRSRKRSEKIKRRFNLTPEYITGLYGRQKGLCALTGTPLTRTLGEGHVGTNASLDRIDSNRGYVKGNVWLVCRDVNILKGTQSMPELLKNCRLILERHGAEAWSENS